MTTLTPLRPSSAPPKPPPWDYGGGDGGEPFRVPWWLLLVALILAAGCLAAVVGFLLVIPRRPLPMLIALIAALAAGRHTYSTDPRGQERFQGWVTGAGIGGGIIGELAHDAMIGVPASVPEGIGWIAVGAGGIGGAIGTAVGLLVCLAWLVAAFVVLTWRMWRHAA